MAKEITPKGTSANQPAWFTLLRIVLGIILIWKGFNFIRDISVLKSLIDQTGVGLFSQHAEALALVVTILTLLCGFFITVGLFTKLSSIVQLPIILVAIIFVNIRNIERDGFELTLTVLVFILLILFAIKGSGKLSADEYFRRGAAMDKSSDKLFR